MTASISNVRAVEPLKIELIRITGDTQSRHRIDDETVGEYAEAMKVGDKFPPVVVYFDGTAYWLADGFHRYHAARRLGLEKIDATVHDGERREAVLYSCGANADHGLRRTNADKRRAVEALLADPEWSTWSDRETARRCRVSDRTVNRIRAEFTATMSQLEPCTPRTYTTKHGTVATMKPRALPEAPAARGAEPLAKTETTVERPKSRGVALRYSAAAIAELQKIPPGDGLRDEALQEVVSWVHWNK